MSLKLKVGEFYLSAKKEIIEIVSCYEDEYRDSNDNTYTKSGTYYFDGSSSIFDLIAHVPKELHYKIIELINSYHTNSIYKKVIDEAFRIRMNSEVSTIRQ